jgi:hypothetical protein
MRKLNHGMGGLFCLYCINGGVSGRIGEMKIAKALCEAASATASPISLRLWK